MTVTFVPGQTLPAAQLNAALAEKLDVAGGPFLPQSYTATGGTTSRTGQDRAADTINVLDFGARGDGVTDDSAAIQAALARAGTVGGIVETGRLRCAVNSSISIPVGVTLRGDFTDPGESRPNDLNYYQLPCQLILGPGVTINMASTASIEGLIITRAGLPIPTDEPSSIALIAAFNGTAITAGGADISMRDLFILGHALGINASWSDPTVRAGGRYIIERVRGDCTNGIAVSRSYDISRLNDCHFWPFMTYPWPSTVRPGIAYDTQDSDWNRFTDCFAFGWSTIFRVRNGANCVFVACDCDGPGNGQLYGWDIDGTSDPILLVGCTGNSLPTMVHVNQTQPSDARAQPTGVRSTGCRFAARDTCVHVALGSYSSCSDTFQAGSGVAGKAGGIYAESGTSGAIIGTEFRWIGGYGYGFADDATLANWEIIAPRFTGGTAVPVVTNQLTRTLNGSFAGSFRLTGASITSPLQWLTTSSGTDQNLWDVFAGSAALAFRAVNDTDLAANDWLAVSRTGYVPQTITLTAAAGIALHGTVGFNGTAPIAKPTGVAVTAEAIHAALVAYGLIAA